MTKAKYKYATILDPRFKMDPFATTQVQGLTDEFSIAAADFSIDYDVVIHDRAPVNDTGSIHSAIFKRRKTRSLATEITDYPAEPTKNADVDPLDFWKNRQDQFPNLARFEAAILAVPAISTPAERAFLSMVVL